jgi:hypothetical protein
MKSMFVLFAPIAALLAGASGPVLAQATVGNVAPAPKQEDALRDFIGLNMLMAACPNQVSPFLLRTVDDYARAAGPKVQERVNEARSAGRTQLHLSSRNCSSMLPQAIAKARLPGG